MNTMVRVNTLHSNCIYALLHINIERVLSRKSGNESSKKTADHTWRWSLLVHLFTFVERCGEACSVPLSPPLFSVVIRYFRTSQRQRHAALRFRPKTK
jgi:hypothetical protein